MADPFSYSEEVLAHHKGFIHLKGERSTAKTPWLGFELECILRDSESDAAVERMTDAIHKVCGKLAIVKHDSSLPSHGIEIVSVPGTLAWHLSGPWEEFFSTTAKKLMSWSDTRTGIHIHLDRASVTQKTLAKMLFFINAIEHKSFIDLIAGREANSYCARNPRDSVKEYERNLSEYHGAVSLNGANNHKKATIEMRLFKGNVAQNGLLRTLEFTYMVRQFCQDVDIYGLTPLGFMRWAADHDGLYPNFFNWAGGPKFPILKSRELRKSRLKLPFAA